MKNPVSIMAATPEYGIGVTRNRFALIDLEEEVDPLELLERKEKEREEKKKAKLIEKETKSKQPVSAKSKAPKILKETQKKVVNDVPKIKEEKDKRLPKKEVNFAESRSGNNRDQGKENWYDEDSGMRESGDNNARGGFRGNDFGGENRGGRGRRGGGGGAGGFQRGVFVRGGGRGRGGFQRFDSRGKREYDRQSGSDKTGVKPVDKRDGSGAHNWGNPQDDWDRAPAQEDDWNTPREDDWQIPPPESEVPAPNVEETGEEPAPEVQQGEESTEANEQLLAEEAEKKEMTLDEWKALKGNREQPKYNVRKPGEGEDLSQWKKMFVLEKRKESEEDDDEDEYEIGLYPQRVGRQKRIFDIDIKFKDTRGNMDTRGRGRGRGRGGPRTRSPNPNPPFHSVSKDSATPVPKVDDEKAFPSLV